MSPADYAYFCEVKRSADLRILRKTTGYRVVFNPRKSWRDVREILGPPSCTDNDYFSFRAVFQGIHPASKTIGIDIFCDSAATADTKRRAREFIRSQILHEYCHVLVATPEEKTQPNLGLVFSDKINPRQELAAVFLENKIEGYRGKFSKDRKVDPDLYARVKPVLPLIHQFQKARNESRKNHRP